MSHLPSSSARKLRIALGNEIRGRRLRLGLTQEQLAERAGLHPTYVGSVERGERNLSLQNIVLLARALKTRPNFLLRSLS